MNADSQTDRATDLLDAQVQSAEAEGLAVDTSADPHQPQTPFPTSLELTREQEDAMVQYALEYVDRLEGEMGREIVPLATNAVPTPDRNTFLGRREKWTMRYYNHVEDRALVDGGLYSVSNITATLSQRITMQMVARANNFFFGTAPWFACNFVGVEDRALAERIDRHSKWKFDQIGLQHVMEQANEFAFVRGESVVKTTWLTKDRIYKKRGQVLHTKDEAGKDVPVLDAFGNFIFAPIAGRTLWTPQYEPAPVSPEQVASGQPIEPVMMPTGKEVLRRDGVTLKPQVEVWVDGNWPMRNRVSEGPDAKLVYFKDFLCPLSAADIHDAELIAHLYDLPVMTLIQMFQRDDLAQMGAGKSFAELKKAVEAIRNLTGQGSDFKAGAGQPRTDHGEQDNSGSPENPLCETAEVYMTYDADGDGIAEEIMLVLDRKNRFPLFYDYTDNVCVKGRRPFEVIRAKAVDGRWYGMGAMEYFEPEQEFIDLCVNRRNFRMSQAGRVTFWNPAVTMEGQANPNLKLNNGKTYRLREGYKAEDALSYVVLPEEGADLMELLNFFMQMMQLKSGVVNGGDQEQSGLPTSDTATGIRNVEKSGQELFAQFLSCLSPGQRAVLLANIRVLYAHLSQREVYRFFGPDGKQVSDTLDPNEVADMDFDVTILLTRVRTEQVLEMSAEARALVIEFYTAVPDMVKPVVATFYRDSLKALGYSNADEIIQPIPTMAVASLPGAPGAPMALPGPGQSSASTEASKQLSVPPSPTDGPAQPAPLI